MYYGYIRVSTAQQKIERQKENLAAYFFDQGVKDYKIFEEKGISGTTHNRPNFQKLIKAAAEGDVIVFDEVSRMSRNATEGFALYQELYDKGVELVFLKEPHINTATYKKALANNVSMTNTNIDYILEGVNKYLMSLAKEQIRLAFDKAQSERDFLSQRTKEGMKYAENVGRPQGRTATTQKSIRSKITMLKTSLTFMGNMKDTEVIALLGITPNSYYKYKRELLKELETKEIEQILAELKSMEK